MNDTDHSNPDKCSFCHKREDVGRCGDVAICWQCYTEPETAEIAAMVMATLGRKDGDHDKDCRSGRSTY